ncbi:MAG: hypothetical protein J6X79_07570 [Bacteroidales bacterium]|nr:hypothetical protein [Bacteroidales bacterium]
MKNRGLLFGEMMGMETWCRQKKYFVSSKNVSNFALSKNGDIVPCIPVQGTYSQVGTHVDQLSVSGRNVVQPEEKLTKKEKNIIVSKIKK